MYFSENSIKFEAVVGMQEELQSVPLDEQIGLMDVVVEDVQRFAAENKLEVCRATWETYRKSADWCKLVKEQLEKK